MDNLDQINKEIKELSVEELSKGYTYSEKENSYSCIFCGKLFDEGVIYPSGEKFINAKRAMEEHLEVDHGSVFWTLLLMDKQFNGLTDVQKNVLGCFFEGKDTEVISTELNITPATVRTHRYNIQRMKREAKILLALMELLESGYRPDYVKSRVKDDSKRDFIPMDFTGNTLHPFFSQKRFD